MIIVFCAGLCSTVLTVFAAGLGGNARTGNRRVGMRVLQGVRGTCPLRPSESCAVYSINTSAVTVLKTPFEASTQVPRKG